MPTVDTASLRGRCEDQNRDCLLDGVRGHLLITVELDEVTGVDVVRLVAELQSESAGEQVEDNI